MTMMDLVYTVADMWGYKRPTKHVSKNVAYILCSILESVARLTRSKKPPLLNKTRFKFLTLNLDFDISKAKRDLGYAPQINMQEGLRRTKAWLEKTGF
jgi:nucleoside-diphosphate-sugar epimerase